MTKLVIEKEKGRVYNKGENKKLEGEKNGNKENYKRRRRFGYYRMDGQQIQA